MADIPNDLQLAAKASNDEELAKMEAELETSLAKENSEQQPESTESTSEAAKGETETPAPTSAEGEAKPTSEETKPDETKPELNPDGDKKPADDSEDEELTDEEVKHLSEKAQKRFKSMSKRLKEFETAEARRKYEAQPPTPQVPAQTPQTKIPEKPAPSANALPWDLPKVDGDKSTDSQPSEPAADPVKVYHEERRKEKILENLKTDTTYLEEKYPELNQDSDQYDEPLATKISIWFKNQFKTNNDLRFKDFVEDIMSLRASGVEKGKSEVTGKVLQQAAEQAISPSSTRVEPANVEAQIAGATSIKQLEELEKSLPQSS